MDALDIRTERRDVRVHVPARVLGRSVAATAGRELARGHSWQRDRSTPRHLLCAALARQSQLHCAECAQLLAERRGEFAASG